MTEIYLMTAEHTYWKETISFAEKCSWKAGPFLAKKTILLNGAKIKSVLLIPLLQEEEKTGMQM